MDQPLIDTVKLFEGLRLKAYQDVVGVWTIGYGTTRNVKPHEEITVEEATGRLVDDLLYAQAWVRKMVFVQLEERQLNALTSFTHNLGAGNLQRSTLRMKLNRGDFDGAAGEFWKWRRAGGKILKGLVRRRLAEEYMFRGYDFIIHPNLYVVKI